MSGRSGIQRHGLLILAFTLIALLMTPVAANALPVAEPGNTRFRNDLQLLNDSGVTNFPLTAWPVALGDIQASFEAADRESLSEAQNDAYDRVKRYLARELNTADYEIRFGVSGSGSPRIIRTFENTPRDDGEVTAELSWLNDRFTANLSATYVSNPFDDDEIRPDGSYVGVALGNWILTAGWQERWWGPSRDGSLILSTNARPTPGIAIQRNLSTPFKTKWLRWLGPWTFASFMSELDDSRTVNDALLFGVRGSFRPPHTGLEIGISRTAQWCGDGRPCESGTFVDLLLGNDNRGVNVDPDSEPGNQLGGIDIRWRLPRRIPAALYMQWIGEDGRGGGGAIGAWMRQLGVEHWGTIGHTSLRTHIEVSDTTCRQGGFGFSERVPNCAYEHSIYRTGYRYNQRALGHPTDSDSLSYSFGSTLVQSAGHSWNISLRYMEINREGALSAQHTLTLTPQNLTDFQVSHERHTTVGRFYVGLGYSRLDDRASNLTDSDVAGFIQWNSQ